MYPAGAIRAVRGTSSTLKEVETDWIGARTADTAIEDVADYEALQTLLSHEALQNVRHCARVLLTNCAAAEAADSVGRKIANPAIQCATPTAAFRTSMR
jgi:hypothetical protein